MNSRPRVMPITGATTMKIRVLYQPEAMITENDERHPLCTAACIMAAPAYPPMRACEEEVGKPHHQVSTSHTIAPKRPARTTYWFTSSRRIMPRPMVLATAVPRKKAARKLKTAAQTTASLGESTRVETTVAMLLAASWKPFRKSKIKATTMVMTTSSRSTFTGTGSWMAWIRVNLGALQHDRFQHVGDILGFVGRVLEHLIELLHFDELDRIFFALKEDGDRLAADVVRFIFKAIDFVAVFKNSIVLFEQ